MQNDQPNWDTMGFNEIWKSDRYRRGFLPAYQFWLRVCQCYPHCRLFSNRMLKLANFIYHSDIPANVRIGKGLYIGHPYCITINKDSVIGDNCNIHQGVTIGQENRGVRKGTPIIGDCVWIGINAVIVGNIHVGNDVLIAPNTYVNRDVPSHSIVFGNPCIIKPMENATAEYINNKV